VALKDEPLSNETRLLHLHLRQQQTKPQFLLLPTLLFTITNMKSKTERECSTFTVDSQCKRKLHQNDLC